MCFKEDFRVFPVKSNGVSRRFQECFQGSFNGVSRKFLGCLQIEECFKGDSMNYINQRTKFHFVLYNKGAQKCHGGLTIFLETRAYQNSLVLTTVSPVLTSNKCPDYPRAVPQGTTSLYESQD